MNSNAFSRFRTRLCHLSVVLYIAWLMLPALQTTLGAVGGILFVSLFGLSVLLDHSFLSSHGKWFFLSILCVALMPFLWAHFMDRGGANFLGYYVQQGLFFCPLLFVSYAKKKNDHTLMTCFLYALFFSMLLTTLTTTGWLIEGLTRGDRVYAYSRSLGSGEPGRELYLQELMLRNIGGYGFVYATVLSLPLTCFLAQQNKGKKHIAFALLVLLQALMVVLSQYTYAMLYTAAVLFIEGFGFFLMRLCKGKLSQGKAMLFGLIPLAMLALLHEPLLLLAVSICEKTGFTNFAFSLSQLLIALQGGITNSASRLQAYQAPLAAFAQSPLFGALVTDTSVIGYHSELLDLLSCVGIVGALVMGAITFCIGHQSLSGLSKQESSPHVLLMFGVLLVTMTFGTILYSNEIPLVLMAVGAFSQRK